MDFLEFYGLKEDPFRLTPDPAFFFPSAGHNEALMTLNYVIEQKEGFCLVIGEPGTGKTLLLNVFKETWKDKAEIALVLTPRLTPEEFLVSILDDMSVKLRSSNKNDILKAFRDFLVEKSIAGKHVIIIVDEAQNLPDETLEELRLLSNLETDKSKLLQIILFAQPELETRLTQSNLRQLNQRITIRIRLNPFSEKETLEYINFRLIKAGKGFLKVDEGFLKPTHSFSHGIPRLINILFSRALMSAYLDNSNVVTSKHIGYAVKHLKGLILEVNARPSRWFRAKYIVVICIIAVLLGAGYYLLFEQNWTFSAKTENPPVIATKPSTVVGASLQSSDKIPSPDKKAVFNDKQDKGSEIQSKGFKTVTVIVKSANLRAEPSLDSAPITWASKGITFEVIDEFLEASGKKWFKTRISDGREGWIADKAVAVNN